MLWLSRLSPWDIQLPTVPISLAQLPFVLRVKGVFRPIVCQTPGEEDVFPVDGCSLIPPTEMPIGHEPHAWAVPRLEIGCRTMIPAGNVSWQHQKGPSIELEESWR